ncbi:MAG: helicase-related protein, partial [Beduini sp.]
LGLVIADEQHRFGVNQRKKLQDKGDKVDLLTMSATPIPRTVAMVLYGDKDVSAIHTMPSRRKTVKTKVVKTKSMKPILPQLESYIKEGGQCYVVCPLVEDSETMDLQSATKIYEAMCAYYKDKIRIGLLHGRMSDEQKDQIMQAFMKHELDILVSTTVIEVGVDVENANMMVIYDAHRFGLSQLHQLRGRVGRSTQQSYCFLFTSSNDQEALERLTFLENETDGFKIAEYDLKLRGPGELLGQKQSGLPSFLVADIMKDFNILERARIDAGEIIDHIDEPQYYSIRKYLEKKIEKNETYLD